MMSDDNLLDAGDILVEKRLPVNAPKAELIQYVKRKVVFIICPDPFHNKLSPINDLKYGFKVANNSAQHNEAPILCYSFKLGIYGFNQWTQRMGVISEQQLFDMQISLMLRCNYIAVYCNGEYTEDMKRLISVAQMNHISRIDIRKV